MKIYFTASLAGKSQLLKNYQTIISYLSRRGHNVIADHILNKTHEEVDKGKKEDRLKFHNQLVRWIKSCDFLVIEGSYPSMSVGYELSMGLNYNKPVILLYTQEEPPALFAYHENEKLIVERYTLETLPGIIDTFLSYIKDIQESRFTFYITNKQATFLGQISSQRKIPKAVYLRDLIDREMKRGEGIKN